MKLIEFAKATFKNPQSAELIKSPKTQKLFVSIVYLSKKGKLKKESLPVGPSVNEDHTVQELDVFISKKDGQAVVCIGSDDTNTLDAFSF